MSKYKEGEAVIGCLVVVLTIFLLPVSYLLNGWVLSILWGWFVVPYFEWAPILTVGQAIGVAMVVGFLTYHMGTKGCRDDRDQAEKTIDVLSSIIGWILHPLITLGVGWIVHQFV